MWLRAAPVSVVLRAFSCLGQGRTPGGGSVDAEVGRRTYSGVRHPGVRVVGRTGRGLVSFPPRSVAATWSPIVGGIHRLLRQLRRGPLRPAAAAAAAAVGDPVRAAMSGRREPNPHHTAIDQALAGSLVRKWSRVAAGAAAGRMAGRAAGGGRAAHPARVPRLRDRVPARFARRDRLGQRVPA